MVRAHPRVGRVLREGIFSVRVRLDFASGTPARLTKRDHAFFRVACPAACGVALGECAGDNG